MYPSLIGWLVIGGVAGWLTGKLMRGAGYGILMDLILGLVGAVLGGWIFGLLRIPVSGLVGGLASATVGSVALVAMARTFSRA